MIKMYKFVFYIPGKDIPKILIEPSLDPKSTQDEIRRRYGANIHFSEIECLGRDED